MIGMTYYREVMADSPVAYWRLGEASGTTAADEMGSYAGTYVGNPTLGVAGATSDGNAAAALNGSGQYITIADAAALSPTGQFSAECWVKSALPRTSEALVCHGIADGNRSFTLQIAGTEANQILFYITPDGTQASRFYRLSSTFISANIWTHVTATYNPSTTPKAKIYFNGVEQATFLTGSESSSVFNSSDLVTIGRGLNNDLTGTIDEVAIYNTALSAARIAAHYAAASVALRTGIRGNVAMRGRVFAGLPVPERFYPALWLSDTGSDAGTWPDLSGNNRHATQADAAKQPAIIAGGLNGRQIRRFDGSNDFLRGSQVITSGDFTMFCVMKGFGSQITYAVPISQGHASATGFALQYGYPYSSLLGAVLATGTGYTGINYSIAKTSTTAYVVALRKESTAFQGILNGSVVGTSTVAGFAFGSYNFTIGDDTTNTGRYFKGDIAEILVFPTALSTSDRQAVEAYLNNKWAIY